MKDRAAVVSAAADLLACYGSDAIDIVEERLRTDRCHGDSLSAAAWDDIASVMRSFGTNKPDSRAGRLRTG